MNRKVKEAYLKIYNMASERKVRLGKEIGEFGRPISDQEEKVLDNLYTELGLVDSALHHVKDISVANCGSDWVNVLRGQENETHETR